MIDSKRLTYEINQQPNPEAAEFEIWQKVRYLVAQEPVTPEFDETIDGYYRGRHVIPGPMADETLSPKLRDLDWNTVKHQYFIRFTDSLTTENADDKVGRALYGIMTPSEANEYEEFLRNGTTKVSSPTTK